MIFWLITTTPWPFALARATELASLARDSVVAVAAAGSVVIVCAATVIARPRRFRRNEWPSEGGQSSASEVAVSVSGDSGSKVNASELTQ